MDELDSPADRAGRVAAPPYRRLPDPLDFGLYALHGALLVFLASDVRRYLPVVRFLAVAVAVFGAAMLGIDWAVRMPLRWTVGEGPSVVAFDAVILWLTGRRRFPLTGDATQR